MQFYSYFSPAELGLRLSLAHNGFIIICIQTLLNPKYFKPKLSSSQDIFGPDFGIKFFGPKIFLGPTFFLTNNFLLTQFFEDKNVFWTKFFSWTFQFFLDQVLFGFKIFLDSNFSALFHIFYDSTYK